MLSEAQWAILEPLVEVCRPQGRTRPVICAARCQDPLASQNGAKWRANPQELGPWWRAAQIFIRWARAGVWERLLSLVQERGVQLGMGVSRRHQRARSPEGGWRGAKGDLKLSEKIVKRLAALVAGMGPRLA